MSPDVPEGSGPNNKTQTRHQLPAPHLALGSDEGGSGEACTVVVYCSSVHYNSNYSVQCGTAPTSFIIYLGSGKEQDPGCECQGVGIIY